MALRLWLQEMPQEEAEGPAQDLELVQVWQQQAQLQCRQRCFLQPALLLLLLLLCELSGMLHPYIISFYLLQDGVEELVHRRQELLTKLVASLGLDSEAAGACAGCHCCQYSPG